MKPTPRMYLLSSFMLIGFVLRAFYNLGAESLWYDEAYTWWVSSQLSFGESIASSIYEIIPPGSYILWRGWIALAGDTEFAMRTLAVLLGVITIAGITRLVYRMTGQRAAAAMTMLIAMVSPVLLWASREVRMYGPLLCMCVLSSMALMEVLFSSKRRKLWLALWAVFSLASLYMVITAAFWLLAQGLYTAMILALRAREQRSWAPVQKAVRKFTLPTLVIAVGFLPWVIAALPSLGINTGYWPGTLTMKAFLKTAMQGMTIHQYTLAPRDIVLPVPEQGWALGAILCGLAVLAMVLGPGNWKAKLYPFAGALTLVIQGLVFHNIPKWDLRHATMYAPFIIIAFATAIKDGTYPTFAKGSIRSSLRILMGGIVLFAAAMYLEASSRQIVLDDTVYHEDWRAAAAYVQEHRQAGDVVIIETGSVYPAWVYYAGDEGLLPLPDEPLLNVYNVLNYANTAPAIDKAVQNTAQVWLVTWLDHVTDPTGIVPMLLEQRGYEVETPGIHGLGLRHYVMTGYKSLPLDVPTAEIVNAELLPALRLWGYTLPETTIASDGNLRLFTWWSTPNPDAHTGKFYQASLRLVDVRGHTWLKYDAPPGGGDYRAERWEADTLVLGCFDTPLPAGILPGEYTLNLIAYHDGDSGEITLGTMTITKGETVPEFPEGFTSVTSDRDSAMMLIGLRLDQQSFKPQDQLNGELFWEVRGGLEPVYGYELGLNGYHSEAWGIMPDFDASMWSVGDRFRTPFSLNIGARAVDTVAQLEVALYDARGNTWTWDTLPVTIIANRIYQLPPDVKPLAVHTVDGTASLVGYTLPERVRAGEDFQVTLYWQAGATTTEVPLSVFLHITPPEAPGYVIAQHDGQPANNEKPLYTWVPGEIIVDTHTVPGIPAGIYTVRTGLYNPEERIALEANDDVQIVDNGVTLPEMVVVR